MKKHVHETLEKTCEKKKKFDKKKGPVPGSTTPPGEPGAPDEGDAKDGDEEMPDVTDELDAKEEPADDSSENPSKRKREEDTPNSTLMDEDESSKRLRSMDVEAPPPPPPPPPPADGTTFDEQGDAIDDADMTDAFQQAALGSLENELIDAPANIATVEAVQAQNEVAMQRNKAIKAELGDASGANGHPSPMQLATPSTSDSYDNFDGVNPERLRQLGVANDR